MNIHTTESYFYAVFLPFEMENIEDIYPFKRHICLLLYPGMDTFRIMAAFVLYYLYWQLRSFQIWVFALFLIPELHSPQ